MSVRGFRAERSFQSANVAEIANDEDENGPDESVFSRLPLRTAFPLIVVLSLASWAILLTAVLWLDRIAG